MSKEKILEEGEDIVENQLEGKNEVVEKSSSETVEANFEQTENKAQEKIKQAEDQIKTISPGDQPVDEDLTKQVADVASLDKMEDQIQKLTEIAVQSGLKTALKVARALNNNYALDQMHDRLINEEELRKVLIQKGFIEKI